MELTPFHLQVAGIVILIAIAVGFLFWLGRTLLGMHRGYPVYMLPGPDDDNPEDGEAGDD